MAIEIFNEPLLWEKQLNCMFYVDNFEPHMNVLCGAHGGRVIEALRYKPEGSGINS
jgi:hypothetical protein